MGYVFPLSNVYIQNSTRQYNSRALQATPIGLQCQPEPSSSITTSDVQDRARRIHTPQSAATLSPSLEPTIPQLNLVAPDKTADFQLLKEPIPSDFGQAANPKLTEHQKYYFQAVMECRLHLEKLPKLEA